jgi:hypothetical protein
MEHQVPTLQSAPNHDLVWDLERMTRYELAARFVQFFEKHLCVYSDSVSQIYTNYSMHLPAGKDRKLVVLPDPYAFHDTLSHIEKAAVRPTGLCILPGLLLGKRGLLLSERIENASSMPRTVPFREGLAHIVGKHRKKGRAFLPLMMKGDLRELDRQMPYIHLHCLGTERLSRLSPFERDDIRLTITRKLLQLHRLAGDVDLAGTPGAHSIR